MALRSAMFGISSAFVSGVFVTGDRWAARRSCHPARSSRTSGVVS
ncbi:MAG: hypothetical protein WCQ48_03280 [Chloroflexota bacterium]